LFCRPIYPSEGRETKAGPEYHSTPRQGNRVRISKVQRNEKELSCGGSLIAALQLNWPSHGSAIDELPLLDICAYPRRSRPPRWLCHDIGVDDPGISIPKPTLDSSEVICHLFWRPPQV
jgi:hypothetical protein